MERGQENDSVTIDILINFHDASEFPVISFYFRLQRGEEEVKDDDVGAELAAGSITLI